MRAIKFRVWHNDQMFQIEPQEDFQLNFGINDGWSLWDRWEEICSHKDGELMQYTGLKDKNGTEIYEGDVTRDEFDRIGYIYWKENEGRFALRYAGQKTEYRMFISHLKMEVIGNIHQNPELLEVTA